MFPSFLLPPGAVSVCKESFTQDDGRVTLTDGHSALDFIFPQPKPLTMTLILVASFA